MNKNNENIYLMFYYITIYVCVTHFYDFSALVDCRSSVSSRSNFYKFLNVCQCQVSSVKRDTPHPHPVSSHHINTSVLSRAFMAITTSQEGDADSSRAPGLTSGFQGSMNVHSGALLLLPQ